MQIERRNGLQVNPIKVQGAFIAHRGKAVHDQRVQIRHDGAVAAELEVDRTETNLRGTGRDIKNRIGGTGEGGVVQLHVHLLRRGDKRRGAVSKLNLGRTSGNVDVDGTGPAFESVDLDVPFHATAGARLDGRPHVQIDVTPKAAAVPGLHDAVYRDVVAGNIKPIAHFHVFGGDIAVARRDGRRVIAIDIADVDVTCPFHVDINATRAGIRDAARGDIAIAVNADCVGADLRRTHALDVADIDVAVVVDVDGDIVPGALQVAGRDVAGADIQIDVSARGHIAHIDTAAARDVDLDVTVGVERPGGDRAVAVHLERLPARGRDVAHSEVARLGDDLHVTVLRGDVSDIDVACLNKRVGRRTYCHVTADIDAYAAEIDASGGGTGHISE